MVSLDESGLLAEASHFQVGINGGDESEDIASVVLPEKARLKLHGLNCRNENLTLRELEKWLPDHPGWDVFYFHAKGCTHPKGDEFRGRWRDCMMRHLVHKWQNCIADLAMGYESVGCHWMEPPKTPPSQFIWAGNFFWAKSEFLITLPSIMDRARIKTSGIGALESRFEAEVWIGNGPRRPKIRDYHANWKFPAVLH